MLLLAVGRVGEILVIWDVRSVRVIDSLIGDFSVSVLIEDEAEKWWFTGVYGPNSHNSRGLFWDEVAGLESICGDKWCIEGDFNVVRDVRERNAKFTCSNFR